MKRKLPGILALSVAAIMIAGGIIVAVINLDKFFPNIDYDVKTWGTISDWMLFGVTLTTLVAISSQVRSQMEALKMQQKQFSIEEFKFRNQLMPIFEVKGDPPAYNADHVSTRYYVVLRNNTAKNINIQCESISEGNQVHRSWNAEEVHVNGQINFHHEIPLSTTGDKKESFTIRVNITFKDIAGNPYLQYAEIIKPDRKTQSYGRRTGPSLLSDEGPVFDS